MSLPVNVVGTTNSKVEVTTNGELITADVMTSSLYLASVTGTTVTNVIPVIAGKKFVMKGIIVAQDQTNGDVNTTIFEADLPGGASTKDLLKIATSKRDAVPLLGLNCTIPSGKYLNFQTDNATPTINITVVGYYINA